MSEQSDKACFCFSNDPRTHEASGYQNVFVQQTRPSWVASPATPHPLPLRKLARRIARLNPTGACGAP
eukprot:7531201-Pyramimonas_sp.AAC.2